MLINNKRLKDFLDNRFMKFCSNDFIESDPICIPHLFKSTKDIEIAGLFASILAFGRRAIIINKAKELMDIMDYSPYDFIMNASKEDLNNLVNFKHRTINGEDIIYIIQFLKKLYYNHDSLQDVFLKFLSPQSINIEPSLIEFHNIVFSGQALNFRTRRTLPSPQKGSSCKRMNMFMRWMVRKDTHNVDFGIWNKISPSQLICPCDVHVINVSHELNLISKKIANWNTALELTNNLKVFNREDPLKYDFALFGTGVNKFDLY